VGCCVDLDMVRFISLLLFIGLAWGQADFDTLILKSGTTYFGEYSKIKGKKVYFKPQNAFAFQPIPVKRIERLELKDGQITVLDGKVNSLTLEEYQKLSTKEKAIYDASAAFLYSKEKFNFPKSILTDSEKEIHEQAYFKKLQKRRFNVVVGSCVFIGVIVALAAASFSLDFGSWGGLNCGPPCGGNIDVDYP